MDDEKLFGSIFEHLYVYNYRDRICSSILEFYPRVDIKILYHEYIVCSQGYSDTNFSVLLLDARWDQNPGEAQDLSSGIE